MSEDRMDGSWCDVKWGSRLGTGTEFMTNRSEEPCPRGDRALVVAKSRAKRDSLPQAAPKGWSEAKATG